MADSPDSERSGAGWTDPSSPAAPSQPTESPDSGTKVKVTQATVLNIAISCPSQLGFFKYTVLVLFTLQLNTPGFFLSRIHVCMQILSDIFYAYKILCKESFLALPTQPSSFNYYLNNYLKRHL